MMGGYPPGLPPLQGPVDGLVSMGSMQPLHPGGPPPHHLPPGVPGLPGIPPPGKNFILIHSLISFFFKNSFSCLSQFFQEARSTHEARLSSHRIPELSVVGTVLCVNQVTYHQQQRMYCRDQILRSRSWRHGPLSDRTFEKP